MSELSELMGLPLLASEHGGKVDEVIVLFHLLMGAVFIGWGAFFAYVLVRFRKKKNPKANYHGVRTHTSTYVETAFIVCEIILLVGFAIPFWAIEVNALPAPDSNPVQVRVVAQQYVWNFHYPGADGIFGQTSPDRVDEQVNAIGLHRDDPNAKDDITTTWLYLPVNQTALLYLSSKDVIHGFALPEFRVKQDVLPGMSIPVSFVPTVTTEEMRRIHGDENREFEIACAQLCGMGHARMRGFLTVLTEDDFTAWLEENAPKEGDAGDEFWDL